MDGMTDEVDDKSGDDGTSSGEDNSTEGPEGVPGCPWITRRIQRCRFIWDANCINAKQRNADINQLEKWGDNGVILWGGSEPTAREAAVGDEKRAFKAYTQMNTITFESSADRETFERIGSILFPARVRSLNERNDVEAAFNAKKYSRILVTMDGDSARQPGGILGNAERLRAEMGIDVMRPSEAVEMVRHAILQRDEYATRNCERLGVPVPWWVGKD
jgi:hypothetical protein